MLATGHADRLVCGRRRRQRHRTTTGGSAVASSFDPAILDGLRRRLEERRDELTTLIAEGHRADQPVSPDSAIGRLTRQDALQQQQMAAALIRRYEQELVRVRNALQAIAAGTYGLCQRCGEPIAVARLNALPYASQCVHCAGRQDER
jgi:DnaK suppressor protein